MRLFDSLKGERLLTLTFRDNLSVAGVSFLDSQTGKVLAQYGADDAAATREPSGDLVWTQSYDVSGLASTSPWCWGTTPGTWPSSTWTCLPAARNPLFQENQRRCSGQRCIVSVFVGLSHFLPVSPQVAQGQTGEMCRSPLTFSFYACRI